MKSVFAAAAALMLLTVPSHAGVITKQVDFSITGYVQLVPAAPLVPPPVSAVTGSFTLTFDPALSYSNQTTGFALNSLNIASDSPVIFTYTHSLDSLQIGGLLNGIGGVGTVANDFSIRFEHFTTAPIIIGMAFGQIGPVYGAGDSSFTGEHLTGALAYSLTVRDTDVPEPFTLSLFGTGIAGMAAMRRRKRVKN